MERPAAEEPISEGELERAIKILEGRDRIGKAAELLNTAAGAAGGAAAAGPIATIFGAKTILGSAALGSLLGGVFVASTPIGWVLGGVVAGSAVAYGLVKMVQSGAKQDEIRKQLRKRLKKRLANLNISPASSDAVETLRRELEQAVDRGFIELDRAYRMIVAVARRKLTVDSALTAVRRFIRSQPARPTLIAQPVPSVKGEGASPTKKKAPQEQS